MNSKFSIEFSSLATRDLRKIERSNRAFLISLATCINSLADNPYLGKPLKGDKKGCYSLRDGDYRIIYEIYPSEKVILIIRVGHRKDIYR
ncbi:MAG: type II toxin-antitoxin system mRNA interferase toxin, RelE/StbE family [Elusimicrobia bacterium CG08_land_8_20_14_0_20_44_26]|nr:MAG: type II toxin-antitoxin system mRNA interferase toxin, RelE/StbE family [Elusimicrobia bacterium CG08_land_8_20_14_0_20_44_26]